MLLNEVLEELANPEPTTKLQEKVIMRLRLAQTIPDGLAAPRARALRSTSRRPVFQSVPESQGIFASLSNSLRDLVWPKRLPPLVLESRPVAVIDRMAQRRSFASTALAAGLHAAAILLIVFLVGSPLRIAAPVKPAQLTALVAEPPPFPRSSRVLGGGGGQRGPAPVSKGAPLLIMEAMKMEHTLYSPADGQVVRYHFAAGVQVEEGVDLLDFATEE